MIIRILIFSFFLQGLIYSQGKVYIVMGSDTGIWEGLDVSSYFHDYKFGLYTDINRNAYKVMDPEFRNNLLDSYNTPLKMTWWMMSGNTFRNAINTNIPNVNSMTFYLMKKYHGDMIKYFGDEISLHYHTFTWTDYDKDGKYWWNQALSYEEFAEDFKYTVAQNLIDENVFPVSYRSGWHYMDNQWQNYLENILPFSMHNDYPGKHTDIVEPLDNLYDWSKAPSEFVPYHPDENNYQIPGNLKSYELRSVYMYGVTQELMDAVFKKAENGVDQVVCIWAHLPEVDFLDKIQYVHDILKKSDQKYHLTDFRYCSAVEAMQRWMKTQDSVSPEILINEYNVGEDIFYNISTNEFIFQKYPFVAVKNIYNEYLILPVSNISETQWVTTKAVNKNTAVKVGFAVTDESGNLSTKFISYLPEDIFIDNEDEAYSEIYGNWSTSENSAWNLNSRVSQISPGDSSVSNWSFTVNESNNYSIYFQIPNIELHASKIKFQLSGPVGEISSVIIDSYYSNEWSFILNSDLEIGSQYSIKIIAYNEVTENVFFNSDVIKISPIVRKIELVPSSNLIQFESVSQLDTVTYDLKLRNNGIEELIISNVYTLNSNISLNTELPLKINGMSSKEFPIIFHSQLLGTHNDTLFVVSNDPIKPIYKIPFLAFVEPPFYIIDNEDNQYYSEYGQWSTSVAQAYGNSSRYSILGQTPSAYADFKIKLNYGGNYEIQAIVPTTVNSSDKALYILMVDGSPIDSIYVNQNIGSGYWISIIKAYLPPDKNIIIRVLDSGISTEGPVLRADAVKFKLLDDINSIDDIQQNELIDGYTLEQNYPNPFNPNTTISYSLPKSGKVNLTVYDVLGREVALLVNEIQYMGNYNLIFNASSLTSGVYFYKLQSGNFIDTKKFILLK